MQAVSADRGAEANEFVFNPTKDLGTRNTVEGATGISMVTPQLSAFANYEEARNSHPQGLELNISRIEDQKISEETPRPSGAVTNTKSNLKSTPPISSNRGEDIAGGNLN